MYVQFEDGTEKSYGVTYGESSRVLNADEGEVVFTDENGKSHKLDRADIANAGWQADGDLEFNDQADKAHEELFEQNGM